MARPCTQPAVCYRGVLARAARTRRRVSVDPSSPLGAAKLEPKPKMLRVVTAAGQLPPLLLGGAPTLAAGVLITSNGINDWIAHRANESVFPLKSHSLECKCEY